METLTIGGFRVEFNGLDSDTPEARGALTKVQADMYWAVIGVVGSETKREKILQIAEEAGVTVSVSSTEHSLT